MLPVHLVDFKINSETIGRFTYHITSVVNMGIAVNTVYLGIMNYLPLTSLQNF